MGHSSTVQPSCGSCTGSDDGLTWISEGSGKVDSVAKDGRDDIVDSELGEGGIPRAWSATHLWGVPPVVVTLIYQYKATALPMS